MAARVFGRLEVVIAKVLEHFHYQMADIVLVLDDEHGLAQSSLQHRARVRQRRGIRSDHARQIELHRGATANLAVDAAWPELCLAKP